MAIANGKASTRFARYQGKKADITQSENELAEKRDSLYIQYKNSIPARLYRTPGNENKTKVQCHKRTANGQQIHSRPRYQTTDIATNSKKSGRGSIHTTKIRKSPPTPPAPPLPSPSPPPHENRQNRAGSDLPPRCRSRSPSSPSWR